MGKRERTRHIERAPNDATREDLLMLRHLQGDETAFPALLRSTAGLVYRYLVRCGVGSTDRDDLFQEVFLRVFRGAAGYERGKPFGPWFFAIVVNTVRSHFRSMAPGTTTGVTSIESYRMDDEPDPAALLEARETTAWLEQELAKLTVPEREVLILCGMERWELSEVAVVLNLPVNTVKTHLRRGRLALARALVRRKRQVEREASR